MIKRFQLNIIISTAIQCQTKIFDFLKAERAFQMMCKNVRAIICHFLALDHACYLAEIVMEHLHALSCSIPHSPTMTTNNFIAYEI